MFISILELSQVQKILVLAQVSEKASPVVPVAVAREGSTRDPQVDRRTAQRAGRNHQLQEPLGSTEVPQGLPWGRSKWKLYLSF